MKSLGLVLTLGTRALGSARHCNQFPSAHSLGLQPPKKTQVERQKPQDERYKGPA